MPQGAVLNHGQAGGRVEAAISEAIDAADDWLSVELAYSPSATTAGSYPQAWSIYLRFAGVVAIPAGFTGVVVVFAVSATSGRIVRLRLLAGAPLEANWLFPIATALTAACGSVGCPILAAIHDGLAAWWIFEFFFLIVAASGIRLLWIFRSMIRITREDDRARFDQLGAPVTRHVLQTRHKSGA